MSKPEPPQIGSTAWEHAYTMRHVTQRLLEIERLHAERVQSNSEEQRPTTAGQGTSRQRQSVRQRLRHMNRPAAQGRNRGQQGMSQQGDRQSEPAIQYDFQGEVFDERAIEPAAQPVNGNTPRPFWWAEGVRFTGTAEEREAAEAAQLEEINRLQDEIEEEARQRRQNRN
ncbi:hypothetical protein DFH27DRAFT_609665 [Peziza echinospora]|nr:hypothetical protein DFH27DRAFT_609665 [Peziza echinospora]